MKRTRALIALLIAVTLLSACGQPEFTYVRDRDGTTYFRVPSSFTQLDANPIERYLSGDHPSSQAAALRARLVWSTAFDQSADPSVDHLLGSTEPFVYATVHQLTEEQRDAISINRLRDFVLPVTEQMRELYLQQTTATGQMPVFRNFELLDDQLLSLDGGAKGVRVRFNYQIGNHVQTFDHTAILDEKGERVSVMLIGCQVSCYRQRAGEFDKIASSFKLLRLPG
ncbi:lipoprotein [Nonomuraea sp. NPDC050783]|uniref:LptM family lipoprotein n=1 Tax=Nonomuraea sp. NPDC050783 TaxID=3154634 RepID=UPI0034653D3B